MQVFEFHFNPKIKEDIVFDSFIYEPENIYEKNLGNLYVVGELTNVLPQNSQFLNSLSSIIKQRFYKISTKSSPESSLKNSLKEANKFLEKQEEGGNISWLGNLNLAVINLKDFNLNLTKAGNIKIIISRGRKIMDVSGELEIKAAEAYPMKVFSNIVSGKLIPEDKIMILTKEAFQLFSRENFFSEIISVFEKKLKPQEKDKELRKLLNKKKDLLSEISGVFILISLEITKKEEILPVKETLVLKKQLSIKKYLLFLFKKLGDGKKISEIIKIFLNKISSFKKQRIVLNSLINNIKKIKPRVPIIEKPLPRFKRFFNIKIFNLKIILILIFVLILIIGGGIYISKTEKQKEVKNFQSLLTEIQQKANDAENALIYKDEKKANLLYQEAWQEISPLINDKNPLKKDFSDLKGSIEKGLFSLNNLEENPNLNTVLEFKDKNFSPQKMILSGFNLYFIDSQNNKIYKFEINQKKGNFIQVPSNKINLGTAFGDIILILSENKKLISLDGTISSQDLKEPYSNYNFNDFSSFGSNLYFLDSQKGEIIKYKFEESENILSGEIWLKPETKKPLNSKSMAVDSSIWILNQDKTISKYYKGELQEEINLDFFPYPEENSKIITQQNLSYIYLLNPGQKTIVILNKNGELIKQYKIDDFNNLKDFAVSNNGKNIYFLNDLKTYQIKL